MMRPVSSSTSLLSAVVSCKTLLFIRPPLLRSRFPSSAASSLLPPASRSGNVISRRLSSRFVRNERCRASYKQIKGEDELNEEACELVNGAELIIGEGDDAINAYLFKAVKNNNGTGILLLSDIFGFEDSFNRDFAYRVACNGYNVLVPDLFRGDPWMRDQPRNLFEQWLSSQDPARVAKDIDASAQWMAAELVTAGISKKLGLIGFCFGGGRLVEALARDESSRFGTGVSFYGTRMDPRAAANVKVPVLFVSGNNDPLCPVGVLTAFEKIIGRGSKAVIFEGRGHGFAHRPESPEEDTDADQAFLIMRNWLHDQLAVSEETPYNPEDLVMLWANKVGPYNNPQETYSYYSLPFCHQDGNAAHKGGGMGEVLGGNKLIDSQIKIKFGKNVDRTIIFDLQLDACKVKQFKDVIENSYWIEFFMATNQKTCLSGVLLGYASR